MYSPVIGGRPASSAYAMPCGTSSAVRTRPATRSWRSHPGWYDKMLAMPGATRAITGSVRVEESIMDTSFRNQARRHPVGALPRRSHAGRPRGYRGTCARGDDRGCPEDHGKG